VFFRLLHLVIEASDPASGLPAAGVGQYLAYTLNFTTFISGPIQRYEAFAKYQFAAEPVALDASTVATQLERIIRGCFKVNVVALLLNIVRTDALSELIRPEPLETKLIAGFKLAALYPFFLYTNFSGYIDMVIGLARLMRLRLPENFDHPFSATSFLDFWNRWHISLSTWLKTYVYNPLLIALMRKFTAPAVQSTLAVMSFFVTFFLIGAWHGRTSEFVLFGVLQGGGVALNKVWQLFLAARLGRKRYRSLAARPWYEALGRGLTFTWFALTLFWFWGSWRQIADAFAAIGPAWWLAVLALLWLCSTLVLAMWETVWAKLAAVSENPYLRVVFSTTLLFAWFVLGLVITQPAPDIVYKAF
jgi:alginate O-acetyltransferase complex protein AlgI